MPYGRRLAGFIGFGGFWALGFGMVSGFAGFLGVEALNLMP